MLAVKSGNRTQFSPLTHLNATFGTYRSRSSMVIMARFLPAKPVVFLHSPLARPNRSGRLAAARLPCFLVIPEFLAQPATASS